MNDDENIFYANEIFCICYPPLRTEVGVVTFYSFNLDIDYLNYICTPFVKIEIREANCVAKSQLLS